MATLNDPVRIGAWDLPNRTIMAPLTRCRAEGRVPNEMMAEYYRQRASAGFILSEATSINPMGVGYPDTPGIWSDEQVKGWKLVTDAVHGSGGRILCQLWHVGRISDPLYLDGQSPVAPSAIAAEGHVSLLRPKKNYEVPRALELHEIPGVIADYRKAAENAKTAGFDGVEIHGANGYLPDQFLHDGSNKRTDQYGGSIENRARFMLEALDAAIDVWGADRVGLHLSPRGDSHSVSDSDPAATFGYVVREASRRGIAFLCVREHLGDPFYGTALRETFSGAYIFNENFTQETGESAVHDGRADAVAYGRQFIANPDLPRRFALGAPLNAPNPETFYGPGPEGYTDYPTLEEAARGKQNPSGCTAS